MRNTRRTSSPLAFTLIELLIVVAIIAILAAIAVPNFLEAQSRSKVARLKADMRTLATGLEAYAVDHNSYVPSSYFYLTGANKNGGGFFLMLSTPVSYITNPFIRDPFHTLDAPTWTARNIFLSYQGWNEHGKVTFASGMNNGLDRGVQQSPKDNNGNLLDAKVRFYFVYSPGPNRVFDKVENARRAENLWGYWTVHQYYDNVVNFKYDPTNGTKSNGEIWRAGGTQIGDMTDWQNEIVKYQN